MATPNKKATFVLPEALLAAVQAAVRTGLAQSPSSLVREALVLHLRQLEEQLVRDMLEAAADPLFLADLSETMRSFRHADAESARLVPE